MQEETKLTGVAIVVDESRRWWSNRTRRT